MIRGIVAIDSNRGMAGENGIPWNLPNEAKYFVDTIQSGLVLMGYGTYLELNQPFGHQPNYVATRHHSDLKDGFIAVSDARRFLTEATEDVWNIGGPGLLAETMDLLDEFYITQINHDFGSTKILPPFADLFDLVQESEPQHEAGVSYTFQIWRRRINNSQSDK